jgi:beta-glucosidase
MPVTTRRGAGAANRARAIAFALILTSTCLPAASRAVAVPERQCQRAVTFAGAQLFKRAASILASCQRAVARGLLPTGTDCTAQTARGRAAAASRTMGLLGGQCSDALAAALALGGDCAEAHSASALSGCLAGSHAAAAQALIGVAHAATGTLSPPTARCNAQAAAQLRTFAFARLRLLQRCKLNPPATLLPGNDCRSDSAVAAQIAAWRASASARIGADCSPAALSGARFGAPCDGLSDASSLSACLLDAAEAASDAAVASEFPDTGFCGDAPVERRIDQLLVQMTLEEKIAQMHGGGFGHGWLTSGVERLGLPGLGMTDGPRGVGLLLGKATAFPVSMARGATWDPALEERVGSAIGVEARAKGASVLLAPTINLLRHPRWGRTQETYSEDSLHLGRMGVGFIRGVQQHILASTKHFAANSIEDTRFSVDVNMDERTLREIYLPHFRMAVQQGHSASVMSAYNQLNGHYCAENAHILHDILKGDWGFQGFVESDWLVGTRSTVPSALAGLDIEMPNGSFFGQPLIDAVANGDVPEATIDAAVRRIVRAQLCFRLDTDPPQVDPSMVETDAHRALALDVAREAIVLLKNDHSALPLERTKIDSIAVVGALAGMANLGDHLSSWVAPSSSVTPLDGLLAGAGDVAVTYIASAPLSPADQATIAGADAAIVVAGLTFADEGESKDRKGLSLSPEQDALIAAVAAANPRTIVVLEGSGAITMPWVNDVAAVLMAWYPGQEGGTAIAEVLFGDVTPSGKLPMSFPRAEADLPPFDNQSLAVTYDYFHGYRYLDRNGTAPLFPFGYGLSYTTFAYGNLRIAPATVSAHDHVRVTADITNTGTLAGDEVAQLYVGYEGSRVDRAPNDLKGFARVHLEPGETRSVAFDLRAADLAFWDTSAGAWEVEPITYDVRVGASSRDLPLTGSFAVSP